MIFIFWIILFSFLRLDSAKLQGLGDRQKTAEENLKKHRKGILKIHVKKCEIILIERNGPETLNHLETKTTHSNTSRAEFGKIPTSCADLQRMGHKANGFYLVKGSEKMEVVDCNFYSNQNAGYTYRTFDVYISGWLIA
jgi:hypothetical protein